MDVVSKVNSETILVETTDVKKQTILLSDLIAQRGELQGRLQRVNAQYATDVAGLNGSIARLDSILNEAGKLGVGVAPIADVIVNP